MQGLAKSLALALLLAVTFSLSLAAVHMQRQNNGFAADPFQLGVTMPPMPTPGGGSSSSTSENQMDLSGFLTTGGVFPHLTATADSGPKRSECGIGALMAWADHLYMVRAYNMTFIVCFPSNSSPCLPAFMYRHPDHRE